MHTLSHPPGRPCSLADQLKRREVCSLIGVGAALR